jgi:hypothetical protein
MVKTFQIHTMNRPKYSTTDLRSALDNSWVGWHLSRKEDGVCVRREWNGCAVWGDSMPDGRLMVWEIDRAFGQDVRALPWKNGRESALTELFANLHPKLNWQRCASGHGPEFIEAMIEAAQRDRTPDVIVAKPLDAPFGFDLIKCKLSNTLDCFVTEIHPEKDSARLAQFDSAGQLIDRGWCPVIGGGLAWLKTRRVDQLHAGEVLEIVCHGLTRNGKFREPRPAVDAAGNLKLRPDKTMSDCLA